LALAGITEVVAPLGTALTPQQATLIRKYTKNVFLLYDSDQAGLKATFRAGDELLANGISVRVISLPDGDDPDTFVAKAGADGFERAAAASVDVFDRKIQILERGGWFADLRRKRKAIDHLLPTIRAAADRVTRDLYISRTSEVSGVSRDMLLAELDSEPRQRRSQPEPHGPPPPGPPPVPDDPAPVRRGERRRNHHGGGTRAERELVRMLLHQRRYIEVVGERLGAESFNDSPYRAIFIALTTHGEDAPLDELAASLDEESTAVLQDLMNETGGLDRVQETVDASINALLARTIADRMTQIDRDLPLADADRKDELIAEKRRLQLQMQALGRPRWKGFNSDRS
jgi:DNA primase